jgi:hypothetical protein
MRYLHLFVLFLISLCSGCASYTTPGGRADFSKLGLTHQAVAGLTDVTIQQTLSKPPLVTFPAAIAVVRVQGTNYTSFSYSPYYRNTPRGAYSVITIRDVEKDGDFETIAKLPGIAGVAGIKRILLNDNLNSDLDLRHAAAQLNANLLLYYTFDTAFNTETHVAPLGLITLGMFPNENAHVTCTASAVLMDTRNGYVYSVLESTATNKQLANAWTSAQAMDQVRQRTEREAFESLLASFTKEWPNVIKQYDKLATAAK